MYVLQMELYGKKAYFLRNGQLGFPVLVYDFREAKVFESRDEAESAKQMIVLDMQVVEM